MGLKRITAPTDRPVILATLKAHLRIVHTDEDTILASYLDAAIEQVERLTWRALMPQTLLMTLDDFPYGREPIYLPSPPFQSITSITYRDSDGIEQDFEDFEVDANSEPGRVEPSDDLSWPETDGSIGNVSITFEAGYEDAAAVPANLKAAILLAAASLYEHREDRNAAEETAVLDLCNLHAIRDSRVCMAFE